MWYKTPRRRVGEGHIVGCTGRHALCTRSPLAPCFCGPVWSYMAAPKGAFKIKTWVLRQSITGKEICLSRTGGKEVMRMINLCFSPSKRRPLGHLMPGLFWHRHMFRYKLMWYITGTLPSCGITGTYAIFRGSPKSILSRCPNICEHVG
jgi:hypothetical protein